MDSCLSFTCVLKRLTGVFLVGAVFLLLAGPLLTVFAVVGVCVLIGFVIWLPLHTVFVGPQSTWRNACDGGRRWRRGMVGGCALVGRHCISTGAKVGQIFEGWWPVVSATIREGVCGGLVGVLVVVLAGLQDAAGAAAILTGCLLGIAVGVKASRGVALRR
jgi:hypothetical protein